MEGRTRDLLARGLGVRILERREESYRTPAGTPLDGDWIGGFVQPGVILNAATTMRLTLAGTLGQSVDEYGHATLAARKAGDRVELLKKYGEGPMAQFQYVGRLSNGTLGGYWYSTSRPSFCGVFWLARVDRLDDATRSALEARVRSWSWRRAVAKALLVALSVAVVWSVLSSDPRLAGLALIGWIALVTVHQTRSRRLSAEVARWRTSLASGPDPSRR